MKVGAMQETINQIFLLINVLGGRTGTSHLLSTIMAKHDD